MKNYLSIVILLFLGLSLNAQAPQGFNYQATVRNSAGELIIKSNVYFKFNVIQGSQTAVPVFTETHYVPTDDLGQVNLVIGQGTPSTGTFSELDWSLGSYYLGIELSINGPNDYVAMGTTQLLSVPYALHAKTADRVINLTFDFNFPDGLYFNSPVFLSNITSYNVPTGKNLYITNWEGNPYFNFTVNSSPWPDIGSTSSKPRSAFALGEGMALVATNPLNIIGFLVTNTVQYVSFDLSQGNYTVPNNKLFIPCWYSSPSGVQVNSIDFFLDGAVDENSIISGTTGSFLGYLKDK
jgi:hypothetical protein